MWAGRGLFQAESLGAHIVYLGNEQVRPAFCISAHTHVNFGLTYFESAFFFLTNSSILSTAGPLLSVYLLPKGGIVWFQLWKKRNENAGSPDLPYGWNGEAQDRILVDNFATLITYSWPLASPPILLNSVTPGCSLDACPRFDGFDKIFDTDKRTQTAGICYTSVGGSSMSDCRYKTELS